ncbi:MAG: hypothetical protein J6M53_00785 [Bacteroidaceae bacterium]|nr:hypothetical protein [Bacteroidaceae bacterium]
MKPAAVTLLCAVALLVAAPLTLFFEIKLAGREAVAQTLPLAGTALALWLSAAAEAFATAGIGKDKPALWLKAVMACRALRFLLAALLLIAYAIVSKGDARLFAVNIVVCYLAVTAALTVGYARNKKHNTQA